MDAAPFEVGGGGGGGDYVLGGCCILPLIACLILL